MSGNRHVGLVFGGGAGWAIAQMRHGSTLSMSANRLEALGLQSSCYGAVIPMMWGVCQVAASVLWYNGFKSVPHTQTQGGKGGVKQQNTSFTYAADIILGLGHGRVTSVTRVWRGKSVYSGGVTPGQLVYVIENWTPSSGALTYTLGHAAALASFGRITRSFTAPDGATTTIPLQLGKDYSLATGGVVTSSTRRSPARRWRSPTRTPARRSSPRPSTHWA
jgi:hypothetical protein